MSPSRRRGSRRAARGSGESRIANRESRLAPRAALVLAICALLGACRQDMHNQPKYRGLRPSAFFADGSSARPLVEGTVARGTLDEDEAFFTGKIERPR